MERSEVRIKHSLTGINCRSIMRLGLTEELVLCQDALLLRLIIENVFETYWSELRVVYFIHVLLSRKEVGTTEALVYIVCDYQCSHRA